MPRISIGAIVCIHAYRCKIVIEKKKKKKCYCRKKKEFVIDPVFQSEGGLLLEMKTCTPHMPKDSKVSIT